MMVSAPEIIKNLTKGFDVSREGLADKMGVSVTTILRWEKNEPAPSRASLILLNQIYRGYKSTKKGKEK